MVLVFCTTRWSLGSGFVWHDSVVARFSGFRYLARGDFSFVFSTSLSGNNVTESSAGLRCLTPPDRIEGGSGNAASARHFDFCISAGGGLGSLVGAVIDELKADEVEGDSLDTADGVLEQARSTAPRSARRPASSRQATSRAEARHLNRARASWRNEQSEIRPLQQRARKRDHDHAVVLSYSGNGSTDRVSENGPCGAIVFGERLTRESEIRPQCHRIQGTTQWSQAV